MSKISQQHLKILAARKQATQNYSKNLAGLKQFTAGQMPEITTEKSPLMGSLEKLAQAAQSIQCDTGT